MTGLPEKIVAIDDALSRAGIAHAFGGALALAWCTERARGTIDIDVNVFAVADRASEVFSAFPEDVTWSDRDVIRSTEDGQIRLWWEETPVDVFFNTTEFHEALASRVHYEEFSGSEIPFLSCTDLAVFKVFFNRTQDWADLEKMVEISSLEMDRLVGVLVRYLGPNDERIDRLLALLPPPSR